MENPAEVPPWYPYGGRQLLISGVFNLFYSFMIFITFVWVCVGILALLPGALGAYQIWAGYQAMKGRPQQGLALVSILGAILGTLYFQPLSAVAAVIAWINLSKPEVVRWLETRQ